MNRWMDNFEEFQSTGQMERSKGYGLSKVSHAGTCSLDQFFSVPSAKNRTVLGAPNELGVKNCITTPGKRPLKHIRSAAQTVN